MERLLIIANPAASGFTGAALRTVQSVLAKRYAVTTEWPTSAAGSRDAAARAVEAGYDVVAAMGGDGVAHHVANGLVHSATALAVIPAGTTNVVARIIRLASKPAKAAKQLVAAEARRVTLAHVTDGTRSVHALFALGIGFDADVVAKSEERVYSKGTFGSLHYARSAAAVAIGDYRSKLPNLRATCDGDSTDAVSVMVQVHSPYTYFGPVPLHLSQDTSAGPAAFAVAELPVHRALSILGRSVLRRNIAKAPTARLWNGFQKLIVEAEPVAPIQADGDLIGAGDYFEITPAPGVLRVLLPTTA